MALSVSLLFIILCNSSWEATDTEPFLTAASSFINTWSPRIKPSISKASSSVKSNLSAKSLLDFKTFTSVLTFLKASSVVFMSLFVIYKLFNSSDSLSIKFFKLSLSLYSGSFNKSIDSDNLTLLVA